MGSGYLQEAQLASLQKDTAQIEARYQPIQPRVRAAPTNAAGEAGATEIQPVEETVEAAPAEEAPETDRCLQYLLRL